jgi:tRNA dimethylallyltransferase
VKRETRAVLIAGPTASGKSGLALALARRFGGVVMNADSMQVYDALAILTARPSAADTAAAPHWLYGHVPAREAYSVGRFVTEAMAAIAAAQTDGLIPILVGGTGLYFKALTQGLADIPAVPDEVRAYWRARAEAIGVAALYAELALRDPDMAARLRPTDPQRVTRALEVIDATGRSLSTFQAAHGPAALPLDDTIPIGLMPERDRLHAAIDGRFEAMVEAGALDEVARVRALGLSTSLPAMRAIGVSSLSRVLDGTLSRADAIKEAQTETRRYAKRQMTFLRTQLSAWPTAPDPVAALEALSRRLDHSSSR